MAGSDPKQERLYHILWFILFLSIISCAFMMTGAITFKPYNAKDFMGTLSSLFMVALFMERALEVFVAAWRAPELDRINLDINQKRHQVKDLDKQITHPQTDNDAKAQAQTQRDTVHSQLAQCHQDRATHRARTRLLVLKAGLTLGVIISLMGLRTLQPLVLSLASLNPIQLAGFRVCDVFLTGGLIAGGSSGIHQVVTAFTSFMDVTKEKNQSAAPLP